MGSKLDILIQTVQDRVGHRLDHWLPPATVHPNLLHEAMRYAVLSGGKRLRPLLVYATGQALAVPWETLDGPACAVELIHAYSLVHDDLPSMDDDDLRRGMPTCHRAYGEGMAVLAGDALQTLAFEVLAHDPHLEVSPQARLKMIEALARASGSRGMAGGQAIDLTAVGRELNIAELENMHIHKTGALIRASVALGALCHADLAADTHERLDYYAKCLGLAFQIRDDILDVEGETATLGKTAGADTRLDKPTYPSVIGLAAAKERAHELVEHALEQIRPLGEAGEGLRHIAQYVVARVR